MAMAVLAGAAVVPIFGKSIYLVLLRILFCAALVMISYDSRISLHVSAGYQGGAAGGYSGGGGGGYHGGGGGGGSYNAGKNPSNSIDTSMGNSIQHGYIKIQLLSG